MPATFIAGEPEGQAPCTLTLPRFLDSLTESENWGYMHNAGGLLQAVQQQLHNDTVLGWFAYRSSASLQPTVQEEAMSSSMAAACNRLWGQHDAAVLFALVSVQQRHDAASYDFEQRMFQLNSSRYYCAQCNMHNKCQLARA